jgi:hypothetical protein
VTEQAMQLMLAGEHHDPEKEQDFDKAYSKLVKKFYYQ